MTSRHLQIELVLSPESPLSDEEIAKFLAPVEFDDWRAAHSCLLRMANSLPARNALADLFPAVFSALSDSASPDRALINLEHFANSYHDRLSLLKFLASEPRIVEMLVLLFAGSQFLTDVLLRHPEYFEQIKDRKRFTQLKSRRQLYAEALEVLNGESDFEQKLDIVRRFQHWELLRIGASDLFGSLDLQAVIAQLSNLAISLTRLCLTIVAQQLNLSTDGLAVIALGKLGGRELNYSSDIDLLFLAESHHKHYQRLGQRLIESLTQATAEGFLYRVDMRLRPWGRVGTLVPSLEENLTYLREHAQLWEKQAMYKARLIAGDEALGIEFLQQVKPLLLNLPAEALRIEIHAMKTKTETQLRRSGKARGEVKTGEGSIRDVEFVTQYLQLTHGAHHPEVHSRNTLDALARLTACGILPAQDYRVLTDGYKFLRSVEHHLQIMHNRQTHQLPKDRRELSYLAKRLGFSGEEAGSQLGDRYWQHSLAIREIYKRYLGQESDRNPGKSAAGGAPASSATLQTSEHIARMHITYAAAFTDEEIQRHAEMAVRLRNDNPVEVHAKQLQNSDWRVTIVAYDYLGELSLICGLLFDYGMNILEGSVFTYEPEADISSKKVTRNALKRRQWTRNQGVRDSRRKIVDVFTIRSVRGTISEELWKQYASELAIFVRCLLNKQQHEVQGELAKRVAVAIQQFSVPPETLLPVEIAIDNATSENYTVLRIDAPDTIGFLYEFTNALALNGLYIARVVVSSVGNRVHDTLFLTDIQGKKIVDPQKQHQLRIATVLVKHFTHLLPQSPNPESAMLHFRELVSQLFTQPEWPKELASLERPEVLDALARLLGVSDFLWNDFLRMQHANLFPIVRDLTTLKSPKSKAELQREFDHALEEAPDGISRRARLNALKDREMFRIDMRYIQGLITEFRQFSAELSDLAEVVVQTACTLCYKELCTKAGEPHLQDGSPCQLSICALGKFGGRELGFASDIELMFIYEGKGETSGPESISNNEFYERLVNRIRKAIHAKREGIYEIDLRLRPYGRAGSLAVSLESFRQYYSSNGPAWDYERQALVKLRPVVGNPGFCQQLLSLRDACLYTGHALDLGAMRAMRERQVRQLVAGGTVNAKFSPGALVDLEYLVQGLQIKYGSKNPELRLTNTSEAMEKLKEAKILSANDFERLQDAHNYLHKLIEALRMVRGNSKDLTVPPADSKDFSFLAKRLGYGDTDARLQEDLIGHSSCVREISSRLLVE